MPVTGNDRRSLAGIEIFNGLCPETLRRLESRCRWQTYRAGKEIVAFSGTATDVYFLTAGRVRVVVRASPGKDVHYRTIEPGGVFGEYAAIDGQPRSASVEMVETSTVACMPAREFRHAIEDEPAIAMALLRALITECRRLTHRVLEFSTLAVRNRVQAELLRLAGQHGCATGRAVIRPAPTHAAIAAQVSTHREAVTRELNRLRKLGIVTTEAGGLVICDVPRLEEMVREASDS